MDGESASDAGELSRRAFNVRNYTSLVALVFVAVDHIWWAKAEYQHIWRLATFNRTASLIIGVLYIWARYSSLFTLIAHYVFIHKFLAKGSVSDKKCSAWFLVLFVDSWSLVLVLDIILFLRVYALYSKNKKTLVLAVPIIVQFVIPTLTFWSVFRDKSFDYKCNFKFRNSQKMETVLQGVVVIVAHASLWVAVFVKRNAGRGPYTLIVKLVVHEGFCTFAILLALVSGLAPHLYASRSANPFILFVWPITVISITACRLIMNMRSLSVETTANDDLATDELHLTIISMSVSRATQNDPVLQFPLPLERTRSANFERN
ncbi:hypothetical protein BDN70DRAFT_920611 [Pholiota conissans]|uniref:Transmembrane protein n=1 Tax=Pholiota conissans TaxID=109636 RepID=A0A9P6CV63_9AGAR|nr:hypothetical protein BDN70DRAFT_920611 [Pholiota conissans]